jgi:DNA-binding SARP family transcriptional activator
MALLTFNLLGGFQVRLGDGRGLPVPTNKAQALLAYLALPPGRTHPRDKLAALLWGDRGDEQARHSLRQALVALRKALVGVRPLPLLVGGESIALDPAAVEIDVVAFERLVTEGTPAALGEATALYHGDLLAGLGVTEPSFEDWLLGERERLRELAIEALAKLLRHQTDAGALESAIRTAVRLLALDPWQESVHRALMRLYLGQGRRGMALRQYQFCVSVLQRELGTEPEPETKQLYQEILQRRFPPSAMMDAPTASGAREPRPGAGPAQPEGVLQFDAPDVSADFPPPRVPEAPAPQQPTPSPLDQLVRGRFVGRHRELAQLKQRWDLADEGHLVLISGEPGVGKTRLAQELIAHAKQTGATILRGGCYEYEATTPYLPFVEGLRDWVRTQPVDALRTLVHAVAPELAKLAPEVEVKLGLTTPNPPLPPNEERLRLFDNVARFLQVLAAGRGLLLFIDDLQWADMGTLSLLHYILRHTRTERLLILATYRDVELARTHPLSSALVDWNRERLTSRLALQRLSPEETAAFVATLLGQASIAPGFAEIIYRETEGNPFFIEEVIKSLIEHGQIYRVGDRWQCHQIPELWIPQSIREAIGRRVARLSSGCTDMLHTAAALGRVFSYDQLFAASAMKEDQLLDTLDEAAAAQLIRPETGDAFVFRHDKIREVLYEELNPIRRTRLHLRIGETLERLHASRPDVPIQDLAHHFAHGGDLERSLRYSSLAADEAERLFAHDETLKFLQQARQSASELNLVEQVSSLDERMGDTYALRGPVCLAVEAYERALSPVTAPEKRAALKAKIGGIYGVVGGPTGLRYLQEALAELNPRTQRIEMAIATALVGRYHHYCAEHTRAIEFLERARALAEPDDDPKSLTMIYTYLAGAFQHLTRFDESERWARATIELSERKNYPLAAAYGYEFLSESACFRGVWEDALTHAARNREIGERIGAQARVAWAHFARAYALYGKGHLSEARVAARTALELADTIGEGRLATWVHPLLAIIQVDMGDDEAALSSAERGRERADESGQIVLQCWSLHALGYRHMQREEWSPAVECYQRATARWRPTGNPFAPLLIGASSAEAHLGKGRVAEAAQMIDEYLTFAIFAQAPHPCAMAKRVQGEVHAARGAWETAGPAYDDAVAGLDALGSRLELGRALYHRGVMWRSRGEASATRADVSRAREIFHEIGAGRDRQRAEMLLRGLPGSQQDGPCGLQVFA